MIQQNQLVAIQKGSAKAKEEAVNQIYHAAQKPALFDGQIRHFDPLVDTDETEGKELVPDENTNVQLKCSLLIRVATKAWGEHLNVMASKDFGNCKAMADVEIDGLVLVKDAPVTFLLSLEKELNDIRTLITGLPVLDAAYTWDFDENAGLWRSEKSRKQRLVKEQVPLVMYDATPEHPAQTQVITQDVLTGHWETTKLSGAITGDAKRTYLGNVELLIAAVKMAREKANSTEVNRDNETGGALLDFIFNNK